MKPILAISILIAVACSSLAKEKSASLPPPISDKSYTFQQIEKQKAQLKDKIVKIKLKRREPLTIDDPANRDCVFWRFFVEEKDWAILRALTNYFNAVATVFGDEWKNKESPLARTIGFGALMRILEIVAEKGLSIQPEARLDQLFFEQELAKAKPLAPFTFDVYPASGAGETKLFKAFEQLIR